MRTALPAAVALLCAAFAAATPAHGPDDDDVVDVANAIRRSGCDGRRGLPRPLEANERLDVVAHRMSRDVPLREAMGRVGYPAGASAGIVVSLGDDGEGLRSVLRRAFCPRLLDRRLTEIGVYSRGVDTWIVLAQPRRTPEVRRGEASAEDVLELVNRARAHARRCGSKRMDAAPPLVWSRALEEAARDHAEDMARRRYFDHTARDGSSPTDRLARTGYRWRLTGENLAYGPTSAEEVVQGWLSSPGHCENIMDARFKEMGVAYATSGEPELRIYWAQTFANPR